MERLKAGEEHMGSARSVVAAEHRRRRGAIGVENRSRTEHEKERYRRCTGGLARE